ncbi:MAG: hypothetical protein HC929_22040 [Leptolyngbyaceae cyanobacterium SM2_5_2]|nr:hypothetical protein [Leptolyngbyaceae cyanobacterium SM2_5_2]
MSSTTMSSTGSNFPDYPTFQQTFPQLVPLILEEWPQLTKDGLLATEGNLEQVIQYISCQTEHTQTLVRRHINELATLLKPTPSEEGPWPTAKGSDEGELVSSKIDELLADLETRTEHLMQEFKAEVLPELERKARSNLGTSLLIALGLGFILGLTFGGKRG